MAIPTIKTSGITFTFIDGDVESVETSIGANLDFDAMPLSVVTDALLFDFNGVSKTITVSGKISTNGVNRLSSGTATTIDAQRKWLEIKMNGEQTATTFVSNYSSSWNGTTWIDSKVMFSTITFTEQTTEPNNLPFRLTLFVGDIL